MSDYRNDATNVRGSHNSHSNNKRQTSDNFNNDRKGSQNINVMKSDTYNIVLTLVAVVVILFSIGASIFTIERCRSIINQQEQKIEELNNKYDVLKELVIRKNLV